MGGFGGKHHLEVVAGSHVKNFNNLSVGYLFVGVYGYEAFGLALLGKLEECQQGFRLDSLRLLVAKRCVEPMLLVDINPCAGFDGCLLGALGQVHFKSRRENECGSDHEEDEQKEDDIGH